MGMTIAQKILKAHLVDGEMVVGQEIGLRIDQTLTQDATGTMAYLQFEAMGVDQVKTERSVAYIDHNTLQSGFENADDHKYIGSVAKKHGIYYSKAGNGICHQVHLERFGAPGKTLIGSDSHTPTGGGIGMLAFGAGGLDVAVAMGDRAGGLIRVRADRGRRSAARLCTLNSGRRHGIVLCGAERNRAGSAYAAPAGACKAETRRIRPADALSNGGKTAVQSGKNSVFDEKI